jgi:hypothetical protein
MILPLLISARMSLPSATAGYFNAALEPDHKRLLLHTSFTVPDLDRLFCHS